MTMAKTERKACHYSIRFGLKQKDRLQQEADRLNLSVADIVRMAVNQYLSVGQHGAAGHLLGRHLNVTDAFVAPPGSAVDMKIVSGFGWDDDDE
jgi:hypothetical protein